VGSFLTQLITSYGYWIVAGIVGLESLGVPLPGETTLILAAVYAGSSHRLALPLVIAAAAAGAIVGDNLGYWIGRSEGYRFLRRYGRYVRLDESTLKVGEYLFQRFGGRVVFFGRFLPILRILAAVLAGTDRVSWWRFVVANAAGGVLWATVIGSLSYLLGAAVQGPLTSAGYGLAVVITAAAWLLWRRLLPRLREQAEAALPGSLDDYHRLPDASVRRTPSP
jgi:membrane protein DedA with SNARE-associated domain